MYCLNQPFGSESVGPALYNEAILSNSYKLYLPCNLLRQLIRMQRSYNDSVMIIFSFVIKSRCSKNAG